MNLLAKRLFFAILPTLFLFACEDPNEIGLALQPQTDKIGVFFTDTISIKTSTVLLDSIVSSYPYQTRLLAGKYADPLFGKITAKSFFAMTMISQDTLKVGAGAVIESLTLCLIPDKYSYGDTAQQQNLNIYLLSDTLSTTKAYYTTSNDAPYLASSLVTKQFQVNTIQDTLRISLPNGLGTELLADPNLTNTRFRNLIKGFALIPAENSSSVIGFGTSSVLKMKYRTSSGVSSQYNFYISRAGFNQVKSDRSNTILTFLNPGSAIPSSTTNDEAYIQALLGIATKLDLPNLKAFKNSGRISINKAELVVEAKPSQAKQIGSLVLAETNATNRVLPNSTSNNYIQQEGYSIFSNQNPQVVLYSSISRSYLFNVTSYFNAMLAGIDATVVGISSGKKPNTGLLLLPITTVPISNNETILGPEHTINNTILAGKNSVKLKVYYSYLK